MTSTAYSSPVVELWITRFMPSADGGTGLQAEREGWAVRFTLHWHGRTRYQLVPYAFVHRQAVFPEREVNAYFVRAIAWFLNCADANGCGWN